MGVSGLLQDVRFAARAFLRAPLFTLTALVTIAIGVGAVTTMFGVVDAILLRPLPYRGEGVLVQVGLRFGTVQVSSTGPADYFDLVERSRTLSDVAVSRLQPMDLSAGGEPVRLAAAGVSHRFFDVLGAVPVLGRGFLPGDDRRTGDAVVVLSHGLWQGRFGGDGDVLGRTLALNDQPYTVIGVMPAGFRGPEAIFQDDVELWFPLGRIADPLDERGDAFLQMIARGRLETDVAAIEAELRDIGAQLGVEYPAVGERRFWVADLRERTLRDAGLLLWLLLAAVTLLLVIACVNVAGLLLVRAGERSREIAVRSALGAGRARVARQLLTESVLLSCAGGLGGALLARAGIALFRGFAPADIPRLAEVGLDVRVLAFALATSILTGLVFGLAPALQAVRADIATRLRAGELAARRGLFGHRARSAFVAAQAALALVLLTGAGLIVNAYVRLSTVAPGFEPNGVAWVDVELPDRRYPSADARLSFFQTLLDRVRAIPGVQAAGAIHGMPLDGNRSLTTMLPEDFVAEDPERPPRLPFHSVLPGYFHALGIPILDGRDVTDADGPGGLRVAVVSATFARRFWSGERAVGKRFRFGDIARDDSWVTVVGVAGDVRHHGLAQEPEAMVYVPYAQVPRALLALVVRHDPAAATVLPTLRETIWSYDASLPLDDFGTLRQRLRGSLAEERFRTWLLAGFAAVALLLSCIGLYGAMSQFVRARRRELGIRVALGAERHDLRRLVVGHGLRILAFGLLLGLGASLAATRTLSAFLFGIASTDPLTYALGCGTLAVAALIACWIPARRAAVVDPARTLRDS